MNLRCWCVCDRWCMESFMTALLRGVCYDSAGAWRYYQHTDQVKGVSFLASKSSRLEL